MKGYISKIAASILALTLVFAGTVQPLNAKAAEESVAQIGDQTFDTVSAAVKSVPADGEKVTIKLLKNIEEGGGFVASAGQNIEIDFDQHTYDSSRPLVGSPGTETNGCQLLKGSTVVMKNGALTSSTAAILIQNYSNLTLQDMTVDGGSAAALSNNCGQVNITGTTSIKSGGIAFDMCWAPNVGYPEGTQIFMDTTGTVSGDIQLAPWGDYSTDNIKSTLHIKNVNHEGKFDVTAGFEKQLTIEGGTFATDVASYVVEGCKAYSADGKYQVAKLPTGITLDKTELSMEVNTNDTIKAIVEPEGTLEEVTYTSEDETIASVDSEGNVTAKATGETTITAKAGEQKAICKIHVYEIKAPVIPPAIDAQKPVEDVTVGVDKEQAEIVDTSVNSLIENILSGNTTIQVSEETKNKIEQAIENGESISTEVKAEILNVNEIPEAELEQIKAEVGNGTIAEYLNLEIMLKADQSGELGTLDVLSEEMTFTIAVPEELQKDGRTFFIVRIHEGNAERIDVTMNQDGTISFVTDRFSTYALAYEDEVDNGSDTEDDKDDGTNDDVTGGNNDNNSANSQDSNKPDSVKTGDPVNTMTIVNLVVLMAAAITTVLFVMKRKLQK